MPNTKEVQKKSDEKRKNNPERIEYMKQLHKQPHIIKATKLSCWKKRGVKCDDFDLLYQNYLNATKCDRCEIIFDNSIKEKSKCLDHDHTTGYFRYFLCNTCNWTHMRTKRTKKICGEKHKDEIAEKNKLYRETHKEAIAEKKKIYYETHKEQILEQKKFYYEATYKK